MNRKSLVVRLAGAAIAFALIGAACGGSDDPGDAAESAGDSQETSAMEEGSGATTDAGVDSAAALLNQTLTYGLTEHEYLAGIAVAMGVQHGLDSAQFEAAAAALDENSQDLAAAIGSVYGDAGGEQFLELWRTHIGFFVSYTEGVATGDNQQAKQAKKDLDGYRNDFGAFIEAATEGGLPKEAVADALQPHVAETLTAIDMVVGKREGNPFAQLKKAAQHMTMISTALAGGIAAQFPDKF